MKEPARKRALALMYGTDITHIVYLFLCISFCCRRRRCRCRCCCCCCYSHTQAIHEERQSSRVESFGTRNQNWRWLQSSSIKTNFWTCTHKYIHIKRHTIPSSSLLLLRARTNTDAHIHTLIHLCVRRCQIKIEYLSVYFVSLFH